MRLHKGVVFTGPDADPTHSHKVTVSAAQKAAGLPDADLEFWSLLRHPCACSDVL